MRPTLLGLRVLLLLAVAIAAGGFAGTASADSPDLPPSDELSDAQPGTYHVWSCRTPSGAVAPLDGWSNANVSECDKPGGGFGLGFGVGMTPFAHEGKLSWGSAPDLQAVSLEFWRTATADSTRSTTTDPQGGALMMAASYRPSASSEPLAKVYDGVGSFGEPHTLGDPTQPRSDVNRRVIDPLANGLPAGFDQFLVAANCIGWVSNNYRCIARYTILAADTRLKDAYPPTAAPLGGALAAAFAAPSPHRGSIDFAVGASDRGSGVLQAVVEVDGKPVATVPAVPSSASCKPNEAGGDGLPGYLVQVPCPPSATVSGSWNTKTVADGERAVRVLVEDAAGNATVAAEGRVMVDNRPAPPPGSDEPARPSSPGAPAEVRGESNGLGADGLSATGRTQLELVWPSTARKPSTKTSVVKRCNRASYARRNPVACAGRAPQPDWLAAWSSKATETLRARLSSGGAPVVGARLHLTATSLAVGATATALDPVVTDSDGAATVAVPRAAGARSFTAKWFSHHGDPLPAAQAVATLSVSASTTFSAPKRVAPSTKVKFSGVLRGPAGQLGDVPITLEVRNQGQWKPFLTATSDGSGRWSARIRFAARRGTYPVRVKVGKSPTFPFVPGIAASARVRVL